MGMTKPCNGETKNTKVPFSSRSMHEMLSEAETWISCLGQWFPNRGSRAMSGLQNFWMRPATPLKNFEKTLPCFLDFLFKLSSFLLLFCFILSSLFIKHEKRCIFAMTVCQKHVPFYVRCYKMLQISKHAGGCASMQGFLNKDRYSDLCGPPWYLKNKTLPSIKRTWEPLVWAMWIYTFQFWLVCIV